MSYEAKRGEDIISGTENNLLHGHALWHQDVTERLKCKKDQATSGNAMVNVYRAITI